MTRKKKPESSDAGNAVITMERTTCLGTCPAYKLTIYGIGRVIYQGECFVKELGMKEFRITKETVAELVDAFFAIDFFSLKDRYSESNENGVVIEMFICDTPSTITSITIDGRSKMVEDIEGAPKKLKKLERQIDKAVNSERLIGHVGWS